MDYLIRKRMLGAEYGDTLMSNIADYDRPNLVSLFTGAGGLDLGLEQAGFAIKACVEWEHDRCETLRLNRSRWPVIGADIRHIKGEDIISFGGLEKGEVDLMSGGPSCQPFSKSAFWVKDRLNQITSDSRTKLLEQFARVVKEIRPRAFLMENVHGLVYKTSRSVFNRFIYMIKAEGYICSWKVLNAADYGVAQRRKRVFVVGSRDGIRFNFPPSMYGPNNGRDLSKRNYVTTGEVIGDIDDENVLEDEKIQGKWGHLLPLIPPGGNYLHLTERNGYPNPIFKWRSRYWSFLLKLSPHEPSWTIQARPGPYTGPFHWRNRRLRIPEIKRLQGFPDEWRFYGEKRSIWAQIGDAVPPSLAKVLGEAIIEQILKYRTMSTYTCSAREKCYE